MTIYGVTVCQQARRHSANGECRWGEGGRGITAGKVGIQYGREGGGGGVGVGAVQQEKREYSMAGRGGEGVWGEGQYSRKRRNTV